MRSLFIAAAFAALAACAPKTETADLRPAPDTPLSAEQCAARGGTMKPVGRMQTLRCAIPYADAGRTCDDKSDCEGQCLADNAVAEPPAGRVTGKCQADNLLFGCLSAIDGGRVTSTICVD
jgi:putative hemolysin